MSVWNRYRRVALPVGGRLSTAQYVRKNLIVQYSESSPDPVLVEGVNKYVEIAQSHIYSPAKTYNDANDSSVSDKRIGRAYYSLHDHGLYDVFGNRTSLGLSVPRICGVSGTRSYSSEAQKVDGVVEVTGVENDIKISNNSNNDDSTKASTNGTSNNSGDSNDSTFKLKQWHLGLVYLSVYASCWVYGKYFSDVTALLGGDDAAVAANTDEVIQKLQNRELSPADVSSIQLSECISYLRYRSISLEPLVKEVLNDRKLKEIHAVLTQSYASTQNMLESCEKELKTRLIQATLAYQLQPTQEGEQVLEEQIMFTKKAVEPENNEYKAVIAKMQATAAAAAADDPKKASLSVASPNKHIQDGINYGLALRDELLSHLPNIPYSAPSRLSNYFNWFVYGTWDHSVKLQRLPSHTPQEQRIITLVEQINNIISDLESLRI